MSSRSRRRENRIAVVQYLYGWDINRPDNLNEGVRGFFESKEGDRDYYSFAEELIHGVLENLGEVDAEIRSLAQNWEFKRIAKIDLAILRLAIYELLFRRDIPPVVSINEAIELSKIFSNDDAKRFINGILDRIKGKINRPLRQAALD